MCAAERRLGKERDGFVKTKKAGLLTKIVVLALLIYTATTLLGMRGEIQAAQSQVDDLKNLVAEQTQKNAELSDAVEHSDDPAVIEAVARSKGYVTSGERIFVDVAD